jgi:hypothetical protein
MTETHAQVMANQCFMDVSALGENRRAIREYFEQLRHGAIHLSVGRKSAMSHIKQLEPAFMITVSFAQWMLDSESFAHLNFLLKKTSLSIWGRRWWKMETNGFRGLVVAEPHILSRTLRGTLHYHILVKGNEQFSSASRLESHFHAQIPHVKDERGILLFSKNLIQVDPVDNFRGLAFYLTKSFFYEDFRHGEFHLPLTANGVEAVSFRTRKDIDMF